MTVSTFALGAQAALRRTSLMALMFLTLAGGLAVTTSQALAADGVETPSTANPDVVVNINSATEKELAFLPGIGPSKASKIVAYRTKRPFKRVTQLARVRGIGLKTVRKLKRYLSLKGETTLRKPLRLPRKKK